MAAATAAAINYATVDCGIWWTCRSKREARFCAQSCSTGEPFRRDNCVEGEKSREIGQTLKSAFFQNVGSAVGGSVEPRRRVMATTGFRRRQHDNVSIGGGGDARMSRVSRATKPSREARRRRLGRQKKKNNAGYLNCRDKWCRVKRGTAIDGQ